MAVRINLNFLTVYHHSYMFCRRLFANAKQLGRATKITFAQGHGYTREEIFLMEKERKELVARLNSVVKNDWHIPNNILAGQAFSYETELFSFVKRIGCNSQYVTEKCRIDGEESLLSSALVVILSHKSTCHDPEILKLKSEICELGRSQLSWYLMNYFAAVFPKISSEILYQLSVPEMCLSSAKCYSMYKQLCLHELIRNRSDAALTLEEYSDVTGGLFLSILLFDEQPYLSAPTFLRSCILNYYAQLDFRNVVNHEDLHEAESKLKEYLTSMEAGSPEVRVISIDGENTKLPLYNIGIFINGECIANAADNSVEDATLMACNAAITRFNFSERNGRASINNLDFSNLPTDLISKGKEIEDRLRVLLTNVDVAKSEMECEQVTDQERFASNYESYRKLLDLRQLKPESKSKRDKV